MQSLKLYCNAWTKKNQLLLSNESPHALSRTIPWGSNTTYPHKRDRSKASNDSDVTTVLTDSQLFVLFLFLFVYIHFLQEIQKCCFGSTFFKNSLHPPCCNKFELSSVRKYYVDLSVVFNNNFDINIVKSSLPTFS